MVNNIKTEPLVSVIIPTFNSARFIGRTIASALKQTYNNIELIVVDDCSSDETLSIVKALCQSDNRIRCIALDENLGTPGAVRNIAVKQARGDYLALLDHDDIWRKTKIRSQINYLLSEELDLVFSPLWQFKKSNPLLGFLYIRPKIREPISLGLLLKENFIQSSSVLVSTKSLSEAGEFEEGFEFRGIDDYDMWLRLAQNHRIGQLNQIQGLYRVSSSAISQTQNMSLPLRHIQAKYPELQLSEKQSVQKRILLKIPKYPTNLATLVLNTIQGIFRFDRQT